MKLKIDSLKHCYAHVNQAIKESMFYNIVVDSLMPYWYGTTWNFNGTTQEPQKGSIACGYFVSTVLRDAGIHLNRSKIGQASSQIIIQNFANKKDINLFYNKPLSTLIEHIKLKGKGIYIVGLDCHVGFLVNDKNNIWFIHAKWANPKAVVKENTLHSGILKQSKYKMIGKISCNATLLNNWTKK